MPAERETVRTAIHWFRRDLRLTDNTALARARASAARVVPVFCWDPAILSRPDTGAARVWFLQQSLRGLGRAISERNGRLVVLRGKPEEELPRLARQAGCGAVFFNKDYEPYARQRDDRVRRVLEEAGVRVEACCDQLLVEPEALATADGRPYSVFTPFFRAWSELPKGAPLPGVTDFGGPWEGAQAPAADALEPEVRLPDGFDPAAWTPGEQAALRRLEDFAFQGAQRYAETRDLPAIDGTSRLSPYLKFGNVSIRTVLKHTAHSPKFVSELCWREFYFHVLWHWPDVAEEAWQSARRNLQWDDRPDLLQAWKDGRTGYPMVDAGMRQLLAEGWMHNRVRMVVASFLTKDLHIHWREGELHFMQRLVDGDLASNNGGWQWAASTGVDPRPLRIFNPWLQSERYDPDGSYIRRWVPELRDVPAPHIHRPHLMTPLEQLSAGCVIGRDYPAPLVDHGVERDVALQRYSQARG